MANDFNPYQAPDAPAVEDFIAVEPRRRSVIHIIAAAFCWLMGGLMIVGIGVTVNAIFRMAGRRGWDEVWIRLPFGRVSLSMTVGVGICSLWIIAGRSFLRRQGRRGLGFSLAALVLTYLMRIVNAGY